jgi:hypothetical protein
VSVVDQPWSREWAREEVDVSSFVMVAARMESAQSSHREGHPGQSHIFISLL